MKKFNEEIYLRGSEVVCDSCGIVIDMEKTTKTRVIAKDEDGSDIVEQYFTCQGCGKHYTITVIDREIRKMIQKRQQLRRQINLHTQIRSRPQTVKMLQKKDEALKQQQLTRAASLKKKYRKECESNEDKIV